MSSAVLRFIGDRRGLAAVEFALVLPSFLLLIIGAFEVTLILFVSGSLESAVLTASRYGITGEAGVDGGTREDRIREIIAERTFGFVDMEKVTISTKIYPSFSSIGQPEPFDDKNKNGKRDKSETFDDVNGNGVWDDDMGKSGAGGGGDVVLYEVGYTTRSMTKLLEPMIGSVTHSATTVVRNEPYK